MKIDYIKISSLEEVIDYASSEIADGFSVINYVLPFSISAISINSNPLRDVSREAKLWADSICPDELHINHGQFIGDGLEYIISQLAHKKTSNRAVFSLMDQSKISNSGDDPIPSFMLMQCNIHQGELYCTAYFRALEVTTFLRINLEEIRQKISQIYKSLPDFKVVNLTIFAFRAYSNKNINTLKIPDIDRYTEAKILTTLTREPELIARLLKQKCKDSTVVLTGSLEKIISSLKELQDGEVGFNRVYALHLANEVLVAALDLKDKRAINSHHEDLERLNSELEKRTLALSKEIFDA